MAWGVKRDWFRRSLLKKGVPGRAVVELVTPPAVGSQSTGMLQVEYDLEITVDDGRGPYELKNALLSTPADTRVLAGDTVPVRVHPKNDKRLAIDWDAL